jgi:hypothetical protein
MPFRTATALDLHCISFHNTVSLHVMLSLLTLLGCSDMASDAASRQMPRVAVKLLQSDCLAYVLAE